jgi:lipopolysaccharide export system protein LptA
MSPRVEHAMSPRVEHAMSPRVEHAMSPRVAQATLWLPLLLAFWAGAAVAQQLDFSHGGPVDVTARDGIEWHQNEQEIIANGDARATRDNVTVTADQLIAHYRKKAASAITPASAPSATGPAQPDGAGADDAGSNEIYRLEAVGNVHIFSATDQAWGDHAVYDMDQSVLVMTGHALRLVTPTDVMTARDSMEYWSVPRRSVARGNALVLTTDGRRISADTLVGYSEDPNAHPAGAAPASPPAPAKSASGADPLAATGKLQRVEAYGNVRVRTATETVYADRGVYVPDTGIAHVVGHVRVTRGQNQINGVAADVNMKTGISTMLSGPAQRVEGLIVPSDAQGAGTSPAANPTGAKSMVIHPGSPANGEGSTP